MCVCVCVCLPVCIQLCSTLLKVYIRTFAFSLDDETTPSASLPSQAPAQQGRGWNDVGEGDTLHRFPKFCPKRAPGL